MYSHNAPEMTVLQPDSGTRGQVLLRAGALLLVCALGGAYDVLNNSFALMAARMASFPEEEEHVTKDRTALVAAAQPSRKGAIRPATSPGERVTRRHGDGPAHHSTIPTSPARRSLTGAGIFQHC
jgi:hypothetical protein